MDDEPPPTRRARRLRQTGAPLAPPGVDVRPADADDVAQKVWAAVPPALPRPTDAADGRGRRARLADPADGRGRRARLGRATAVRYLDVLSVALRPHGWRFVKLYRPAPTAGVRARGRGGRDSGERAGKPLASGAITRRGGAARLPVPVRRREGAAEVVDGLLKHRLYPSTWPRVAWWAFGMRVAISHGRSVETFGADGVVRLPEADVAHGPTRRWLSDVGLPPGGG